MSRTCGSSQPTPTPLNSLAMKPGKTRRKVIEGNAFTIIRQTTRQKPAAYRQRGGGGETKRRYGKTNHRQNPPAYRSRGGGGETKKGELKNTGAKTRETKVKTFPQTTIVAGGARQKAKTNTKRKGCTTHSPARAGKCLAENA